MKKKLFGTFLSFIILVSTLSQVSAANTEPPAFGYRMINGIGNVTVYIDSGTGATYWQRLIKDAVYNWMYTGFGANPLYTSYVSSGLNGSKMDFYGREPAFFQSNKYIIPALTLHYSYAIKEVNPSTTDWYSGTVFLNDTFLKRDDISDTDATSIMIHEIGHVLGLAHNNSNPNSIMCQKDSGRVVNTVQKVDNDALNRLY